MNPASEGPLDPTRRKFINQLGSGFTTLALTGMLSAEGFFKGRGFDSPILGGDDHNPLAPKPPHFKPKAKNVIFLFMYGGPSQMETFDYKPKLYPLDGKTVRGFKTHGRGGHRNGGRVVGPKWGFKQYGESGQWVSDLFPNLATCVDDIAFIKSMTAISPIHGSALLQMNSGEIISGSPSLGSWVNYGLGSINANLPGFVVMVDPRGGPISGAKNWSSGYMPAVYQATTMRPTGDPILHLGRLGKLSKAQQRHMLDVLRQYNSQHLSDHVDNSDLAARISSYELAFRMQKHAPEAVDLSDESEETKKLYGMDDPVAKEYGRRCLLARRMIERGVRFIELLTPARKGLDRWDQHARLIEGHTRNAHATDKPIAALLKDLKGRGLLDDTLIVWGGEFGRTPTAQTNSGKFDENTGRDHNPFGFTMWLAGGGVKGGLRYGATDEYGYFTVENKVHVHDLHATMLHLLGMDHKQLTYRYSGRDMRLTDVHGEIVHDIIA